MSRLRGFGLVAILGAAAAATAWYALGLRPATEPTLVIALQPGDAALVDTGAAVYREHCAACHGANLDGEDNWRQRKANGRLPAPPHDQTGHTWHHSDELLFALTKHGPQAVAGGDYQSDMPAYDSVLSDREIIAVLSFIKSRWPQGIQARHDQINAAQQQDG